MKKLFSLFMAVLLLANVALLGYDIADRKAKYIELLINTSATYEIVSDLETDVELFLKALLFDEKKAKILLKRLYRGVKKAKKELKLEEEELIKKLKGVK